MACVFVFWLEAPKFGQLCVYSGSLCFFDARRFCLPHLRLSRYSKSATFYLEPKLCWHIPLIKTHFSRSIRWNLTVVISPANKSRLTTLSERYLASEVIWFWLLLAQGCVVGSWTWDLKAPSVNALMQQAFSIFKCKFLFCTLCLTAINIEATLLR